MKKIGFPTTITLYLCHNDYLFATQTNSSLHITMDHTPVPPVAEERAPLDMPESLKRRQHLRAIAAGGENLYEPPTTAEAFALLEAAIDEVKHHDSTRKGKELIARRQRLTGIVATCKDLYEPPDTAEAFARLEAAIDEVKRHASASDHDSGHEQMLNPPNTAEAFALLEAAMDEVKRHSSTSGNDSGQEPMLDPPNTAERFNRIERAIDEVLAGRDDHAGTIRQAKRSKSDPHLSTYGTGSDRKEGARLLRKRQLRFADQNPPSEFNHSIGEPRKETEASVLARLFSKHRSLSPSRKIHEPSNGSNDSMSSGEVGVTRRSAVELPVQEADDMEQHSDVDIFRDDDSVQAFANQTYLSAREKYI
jgi:hypothetical protein